MKPSSLQSTTSLWWDKERLDLRINGTFKGGGAKAVMYAGALCEIRERGLWFRAVAGSSAGAITAALIAAGLTPEEIAAAVPEGLRGVSLMILGDLVGSPLFRTKKLASWLEQLLRKQVQNLRELPMSRPVTFADLYGAFRIELYVVAVDVFDRQPRIFSVDTSPHLSVADAVLASSAIPIAFRPGWLAVRDEAGKSSLHQLVDGGVWANYPVFVFKDPSFRAYHQLGVLPEDSLTIGFTLDTAPAKERGQAVEFLRSMSNVQRHKERMLRRMFLYPLRLYFMTIVPLVIAAQTWYTIKEGGLIFLKDYFTRPGVPSFATRIAGYFDGFFSHFPPGYGSVLAFLIIMSLFLALLGGTLLEFGVPAIRTLMSVGTDVPYWIGLASNDHVIRLRAPSWLQTMTFRLASVQISEAVAEGRAQAKTQLSEILKATDSNSEHG